MQILNLLTMMQYNKTIFDSFPLDTRLNREQVVNSIICKSGRSYPYWQDSRIFKIFLNNWFMENANVISRLYETTILEYNPIENYNRYEEGTKDTIMKAGKGYQDTGSSKESGASSEKETITNNLAENNTREHTVSAFDSGDYQPSNKDTENSTKTGTVTTDTTGTHEDTSNHSATRTTNGQDEDNESYNNHMHGNIGVTTTQQMINQEREVALFSIYKWIAQEIDRKLFYGVYNDNLGR